VFTSWALRLFATGRIGVVVKLVKAIEKFIAWVLRLLGIDSLGATLFVGALITVFSGMAMAAFLFLLVTRVSRSTLGAFVKSTQFIPVVSAISIIVPTVTTWFSVGRLAAVGIGVGTIIQAISARSKLRELQEEMRKDRPSESTTP